MNDLLRVGSVLGGGGLQYWQKVKNLFGSSVVAYHPLWEGSGLVAADQSGNGRDGAYKNAGITYGVTGIGDGRTAVSLASSNVNLYSVSLRDAFPISAGAWMLWIKVSAAGIWTDNALHIAAYMASTDVNPNNNRIMIYKMNTGNTLRGRMVAGGTNTYVDLAIVETGWIQCWLTWDKAADELKFIVNGAQAGTTQTGLGVFAGIPASLTTLLGDQASNAVANPWSGGLAHSLLINRTPTPAEVAACYYPF